jgi:NAD-dependent dihydropyrimidine dehydrogenase PreA subunit
MAKIIKIDEEKCNGCGLCVPSCHEGAIQIINGKAKIIPDKCDAMGACIGHCPEGAITIEEVVEHHGHDHSGCPGAAMIDLSKKHVGEKKKAASGAESELKQWPVQIKLVPPHAPYFSGSDLLIAADCVPFAYPDFHADLLRDHTLLVGCPKLDDIELYREKIFQIVKENDIKSITYAHMEVPCCSGLIGVIEGAISASGKKIPFHDITITLTGEKKR